MVSTSQFFSHPLPEPQPLEQWQQVTLEQLIEFFAHPIKYLLNHRLGIRLKTSETWLESTEPFQLGTLEAYQLKQLLTEKGLQGKNLAEYRVIVSKMGILPYSKIGDYSYEQVLEKVQPFISQVQQHTISQKLASHHFHLSFANNMTLSGQLSQLWQDQQVYYRCAKLKSKDYIKAWLPHLVLSALQSTDSALPQQTVLLAEDETKTFTVVANAQHLLQHLLEQYWRGLQQPELFFPESSFEFVKILMKQNNDEEDALRAALDKWSNFGDFQDIPKEGEDEYHLLCFGNTEANVPLQQAEFKIIAKDFFIPLWQALSPKVAKNEKTPP